MTIRIKNVAFFALFLAFLFPCLALFGLNLNASAEASKEYLLRSINALPSVIYGDDEITNDLDATLYLVISEYGVDVNIPNGGSNASLSTLCGTSANDKFKVETFIYEALDQHYYLKLVPYTCEHTFSETYSHDANGHWRTCTICGEKSASEAHSGGTATCTTAGACTVCSAEYISKTEHSFGSYSHDANGHWRTCTTCGKTSAVEEHSGGEATCSVAGVCSVCREEYISKLEHSFGSYFPGQDEHSRTCTTCGATETEAHSFVVVDLSKAYHASDATCTEPSKYYYSCACGAKGSVCFENGEALGHSYDGVYSHDATGHWRTCTTCGKTSAVEEHSGGVATCSEPGACSVCGKEYLASLEHTPDTAYTTDDTYHYICCKACNTALSQEAHSFDATVYSPKYLASTATCTEPIKYYYSCECGATGSVCFSYGEPLGHDFGSYSHDANEHWRTCATCETRDAEVHSFVNEDPSSIYSASEATCTEPSQYYRSCVCGARSSVCFSYGEPLGHSYGKYISNKDGTHSKTCSTCKDVVTQNCHTDIVPKCGEYKVCEDCNSKYGEEQSHSLSFISEVPASCTTSGNISYYICSDCSLLFDLDYSAITDISSTVIPAGHIPDTTYVTDSLYHYIYCKNCTEVLSTEEHSGGVPTCTSSGICSKCSTEYTAPLGHSYGKYISNKDGTHSKTCSTCKDVVTQNCHTDIVPKCGEYKVCEDCNSKYGEEQSHSLSFISEVPASCTTSGNISYYICSDCGLLFDLDYSAITDISSTVIPAGHIPDTTYVTDSLYHYIYCKNCTEILSTEAHCGGIPTCTSSGVCSVCTAEYGSPLGHSVIGLSVETSPTKTVYRYGEVFISDGLTLHAECSSCAGYELDDYTYSSEPFTILGTRSVTVSALGYDAHVSVTVEPLTLSVNDGVVSDLSLVYDGEEHSLIVDLSRVVTENGYEPYILFGLTEGVYSEESYSFTHVTDTTVYYVIYAEGHTSVYGSISANISPRSATLSANDITVPLGNTASLTYAQENILECDLPFISLSADIKDAPGEYEILPALSSSDYDVTTIPGKYVVLPTELEDEDITVSSPNGLPADSHTEISEATIDDPDLLIAYSVKLFSNDTEVAIPEETVATLPLPEILLTESFSLYGISADGTKTLIEYEISEGTISFALSDYICYSFIKITSTDPEPEPDIPAPKGDETPTPDEDIENPTPDETEEPVSPTPDETEEPVSDTQEPIIPGKSTLQDTESQNPSSAKRALIIVGIVCVAIVIVFLALFFPIQAKRKHRR